MLIWALCFHQVAEWHARADNFEKMCCAVMQMFTRLSNSANRTILYDLYPYIWDIKSIISMVKSFVQWLGRFDFFLNGTGGDHHTFSTHKWTVSCGLASIVWHFVSNQEYRKSGLYIKNIWQNIFLDVTWYNMTCKFTSTCHLVWHGTQTWLIFYIKLYTSASVFID